MGIFKTYSLLAFVMCLIWPTSSFAQFSEEITLEHFTHGVEVDGAFVAYSHTTFSTSQTTTPFGLAKETIWIGTTDEFVHTINLLHLSEYGGAIIATHSVAFSADVGIDGIVGFALDFPRAANTRLAYGPADNTSYKIEDTLNIPAVTGYEKDGNMLFGGTPFNDVWTRDGGLFVAVLADQPDTFELPVSVDDDFVFLAHRYYPDDEIGAQTDFEAGDVLTLPPIMVGKHQGDYFTPLRSYIKALEVYSGKSYIDVPLGNPTANQPYWKTWGLDKSLDGAFTVAQVLEISDLLAARGIRRIMLDYGWFVTEGVWDADEGPGFADNDELRALIRTLEQRGFETGLWYQPLQVDAEDETVQNEILRYAILDEDGDLYIDDDDLALLDPSNPAVLALVRDQMRSFRDLGVKHLYLDSQEAQLAAPPNFALDTPLQSHRALPRLYDLIRAQGQELGITIEICPDGRSQTLLNMPHAVTNIGDPNNDRQLRAEHRWLTAIQGSQAIIGTYVETFPDNGTSGSFLNIVGIGGNLQSIGDFESLQNQEWDIWMQFFNTHRLETAEYLPLYDIAFDTPETHVLRRGTTLYYSLFARDDDVSICLHGDCIDAQVNVVEAAETPLIARRVELRGLQPNATYQIQSFPEDTIRRNLSANADGHAYLDVAFTKELMLVVSMLQ